MIELIYFFVFIGFFIWFIRKSLFAAGTLIDDQKGSFYNGHENHMWNVNQYTHDIKFSHYIVNIWHNLLH